MKLLDDFTKTFAQFIINKHELNVNYIKTCLLSNIFVVSQIKLDIRKVFQLYLMAISRYANVKM